MSLLRAKYDDQTDYEDPIDRYQRRGKGARVSTGEMCAAAKIANVLGILSIIPFLGIVCIPLTWLLAFIANGQLNANPVLQGRHQNRNAFAFSMIGLLVNIGAPVILMTFFAR
jgi:hypothetical protein